jgi:hypothetical protein
MAALTIFIIRHAEKPGETWPGPGLTPAGVFDKKSLVIRGWQRAGSWAGLFAGGFNDLDYPRPSVIYTADPNSAIADEPSQRPYETVIPLADRLGLTPDTTYAVGQEAQLVAALLTQTGVVLISWEHKKIAGAILPAIASGQTLSGMPTKWDGTRFDVVLRFDRNAPDAPWSFRQLFPCLLSGDSAIPMR